jgi:predicted TIM-barrel fold metal-dependent hydrolase
MSKTVFLYNKLVIIDFHTHIFSPKLKEYRERYIKADPCFAELYSSEKARMTTAEELIESMDDEGIGMAVVLNIGWSSHELCVETNNYILESIDRYPDRLIGFCAVQPSAGDTALKEIERCVKNGIRGIGEMRPDTQSFDLTDGSRTDDLADLLIRKNLIFLVHSSEPVGHLYQGKGSVTPDRLYPFISRYPELTVVAAHWGGGLPFYFLMPEVKKACKNVYFDTAASPYLYDKRIYQHVITIAGADKILFGTDYPLMRPKRLLNEIDSLELSTGTREMILRENAAGLLGIQRR